MPLLVFVARQVPSTAPGTGSSGCEKVSLPSKLAGFWRLERHASAGTAQPKGGWH